MYDIYLTDGTACTAAASEFVLRGIAAARIRLKNT